MSTDESYMGQGFEIKKEDGDGGAGDGEGSAEEGLVCYAASPVPSRHRVRCILM